MMRKNRPKIMHLVISLDTGGLERLVVDFVSANSDSIEQFVVCLERSGTLSEGCQATVTSLDLSAGLHPGAVIRLVDIIRQGGADLVHTHNEKALFYGAIAAAVAGVPVIHTNHGGNSGSVKGMLKNNILARLCFKMVAVSDDTARHYVAADRIPADKVVTVLNGVDTDRFDANLIGDDVKASLRASLKIDPTLLLIGIVARLAPVKDHATLLHACTIVVNAGYDFKLLVVGDGPLRGDLADLSTALGLDSRVLFAGERTDIPELMSIMDIFVLSSENEGISLTLVEAMASELPIVATDAGGNPEVVIDGETGFIVPKQQPAAMAEKIISLLVDEPLRRRFGSAGRSRAVDRFSIKRTCREYKELYFAALSR